MNELTQNLAHWAHFLRATRSFFDGHGYTEVSTPHLVTAGAFEASIDTLKVSWASGSGELHSSPEIEMKSLLAKAGISIYQICRSFRDDPDTGFHWKEFTMLEYYRMKGTLPELISEMKTYLKTLSPAIPPFIDLTAEEAIRKFSNIPFSNDLSLNELRTLIEKSTTLHFSETDGWGDLFFRLMVDCVEPVLPFESPVFISGYPTIVSPLSQSSGNTAQRFELYWRGMEICNGCVELGDERELKKRFVHQNRTREKAGKPPHPYPQTLFDATASLPPCAGVAVGMERLFRCL